MTDLKLLEKLCCASGISGNEKNVRDIIISEIRDYVDELRVDNVGNIIVLKKGRQRAAKKLMISAHMDEVGFIVTSVTNDGFLNFSAVGGVNDSVIAGKKVFVGDCMIPGIIGIKPVHLSDEKERKETVPIDELYIDIGAVNKDDALKSVRLGDCVSFEPNFKVSANGIISAKAIDDRAGCFILIKMIKREIPFDMYFAFVVQEEVGLCGAKVAAYSVNPDSAIVVEATTASDIPGIDDDKKICKLNEGAVISFMDRATIYDREYYDLCFKVAQQENVKIQTKQAVAGGNDSGAINVSRNGVRTIALSLPCRYLHGPTSVISTDDMDSTEKILYKLASVISGEGL